MYKLKFLTISIILLLFLSAAGPMSPQAYPNPAAVPLLTVSNFAVLAASTVTSPSGPTVLNNGDLGTNGVCTNFIAPCTGPITGTINSGTIQLANGVASQGQIDATAAVTNLTVARTADQIISAGTLTGLTLDQGVYDVTSVGGGGADLTGNLTLRGDANSIFIFRFNDTFITSGAANILFTGAIQVCNVYWVTASAATFNDATHMVGTVFAQSAVTFPGGGAVVDGRVIAQTAAVDFNNTTINNQPVCVPVVPPTGGGGGEEEGSQAYRPPVRGLPNTGGAPIQNDEFPWSLLVVGGLGAIALGLGVRSYRRRTH